MDNKAFSRIAEVIKSKLEAYLSILSPELKEYISLLLDPVSLSIKKDEEQGEIISSTAKRKNIYSGKCKFIPCFNGRPFPDSKFQVSWEKGKLHFDRKAILLFLQKREKFLLSLGQLRRQPLPYLTCFAIKYKPNDKAVLGLFKDFLQKLGIMLRESELRELLGSEFSRLADREKAILDYDLSSRLADLTFSKAEFKSEFRTFVNYLKEEKSPFKLKDLEDLINDAKAAIKMEKFARKLLIKRACQRSRINQALNISSLVSPEETAHVFDDMIIKRGLWGLKLMYFCFNYKAKEMFTEESTRPISPLKPAKKEEEIIFSKSIKPDLSPIRLTAFLFFKIFERDEMIVLERACQKYALQKDTIIYTPQQSSPYLFLISSGEVKIFKETSYGEVTLGFLRAADFLGEEYMVEQRFPENNAEAATNVTLYGWEIEKLKHIFKGNKFLATKFFWVIWQSLAIKLRKANEELGYFFQKQITPQKNRGISEVLEKAIAEEVKVDEWIRHTALKVKGLSAQEMEILSQLGREEFYSEGSLIFNEGDKGNSLYIILDGQVRISKDIAGIGEEALAILEKGDYFGEMALADAQKRSAAAKAHSDGVTLLTLSRKHFNDVLSSDINIAEKFIHIICHILSERLIAFQDRICQWKIMAGSL